MKRIFQAIIFSVVIIFSSCSNNVDGNVNDSTDLDVLITPGGSNIPPVTLSSGLNAIDANGKRQGPWIIYGKMQNDKAYNPTSKFEEGTYKDDLKEGEWTEYNPDGTVKRKVNYVAGKEVK